MKDEFGRGSQFDADWEETEYTGGFEEMEYYDEPGEVEQDNFEEAYDDSFEGSEYDDLSEEEAYDDAFEESEYDDLSEEEAYDDSIEEAEYFADEEEAYDDPFEESEYESPEEMEYYDEADDIEAEASDFSEESEYDEFVEDVEEYAGSSVEVYEEDPYAAPYEEAYEEFSAEDYYVDNDHTAYAGAEKGGLKGLFSHIGKGERVMLAASAVLLVMSLMGGVAYLGIRTRARQIDSFSTVGTALEGLEVIGDGGLAAVADVIVAKAAEAETEQQQAEEEKEEPKKEYEEVEYTQSVTVTLKMLSVKRDLKIKFINKSTDKLISNTPFSVTVTTADKKTEVWSDDDMDGIIYKKDITPGQYKVAVNALAGKAYAGYVLPADAQKTEVKKDIDYKKIDVSDEVKTEAQINVATEEQKKQEPVVESVLTDTVKWVESTAVNATYIEVAKSSIADPAPAASGVAAASVSPGDAVQLTQVNALSGKLDETVYVGVPVSVNVAVANLAADAVMTASSSNTGVATVAASGRTLTISGVSEGSAVITMVCTKNGATAASASWTVNVKRHAKDDTTTPLKDKEGNPLYVSENNTYRAAVYADYYKDGIKLFKKGNVKYTGWQTLDGKVYYFDESGEKVTGEQVIQGAKYSFASDGSLVTGSGTMGIDVSKHNGNIDWNAVKNSGVSYAIIRCGYRGYTQGSLIEDPKFTKNIQGATAAGLKVGIYFFSQAVDEVEAVAEASFVLDKVKGYQISYPIFLDVEYSGAAGNKGRADGLDSASRTAVCKAFCATIQSYGYTAGVYANKTWLQTKIDPGQLGGYKIWLAQYAAEPTYAGRFDMWQYKSTGQVSGIKGNVDMNISYLGY